MPRISKRLRDMHAEHGKADRQCRDCAHYDRGALGCKLVPPKQRYDWNGQWQACGAWREREERR